MTETGVLVQDCQLYLEHTLPRGLQKYYENFTELHFMLPTTDTHVITS
jgi:hypothetical protein